MKKTVNLMDFSGGYTTDLPPDLTPATMLVQAENVIWKDGLEKRGGVADYSTASPLGSSKSISGFHRVYINSAWHTIIAVDDGTDVKFYQGTAASFTVIAAPAAYTFTKDNNVEMDDGYDVKSSQNAVVCVNGTDKPAIIYYDSGFKIQNLEAYDERTRVDDDWWAGQFVAATTTYTDDTDDAQDSDADDFQLCTATNDDGFYISGQKTFNKVTLKSAQQWSTAPTVSYQYYKDNDDGTFTWTSVGTLVTTPTWEGAEGDRTIEFNIPTDWGLWDGTETTLNGRYIFRVTFTANAEDKDCDSIEIYHSQYLSQIMGGEKPQWLKYHRNRMYLAANNNINISPYVGGSPSLTGWRAYDVETTEDGGPKIIVMETQGEDLIIMKPTAIYRIIGNSYENRTIKKVSTNGTQYGRSVCVVNNVIWYLHTDGTIHGYDGSEDRKVTPHIKTDIASFTATGVYGINYAHRVWMSFPSSGVILNFDPDSARSSHIDAGEFFVSVFKLKTIRSDILIWFNGESDTGALIGANNSSTSKMETLDNTNAYDSTATTIPVKVKTKRYAIGTPNTKKTFVRVKPQITASGAWTLIAYVDHEARNTSVDIASGSGGDEYTDDISLDYDMDGKNISFYIENDTVNDLNIYGLGVDVERRKY